MAAIAHTGPRTPELFRLALLAASLVCASGTGAVLRAASSAFATGPVNFSSGTVNAIAIFDLNPGDRLIELQLLNLQENPTGVAQLISGIRFTMSGLADDGPAPTVTEARATEILIDRNGIVTEQRPLSADTWHILPIAPFQFSFCEICEDGGSPARLLIGGPGDDGTYAEGNGSIRANDAHLPFLLASSATYSSGILAGAISTPTWTISMPGLRPMSAVTAVQFTFGTAAEVVTDSHGAVPEPGAWALVLTGIALVAIGQYWKRRRRA